ncbi:heptaprenyl diphosphate synthase component 1 [Ornithinibacillus massiliensis]|nr:heptaprenyl diphosphate synthase component 1 [Ornithinibacillus massiliensis]
MINLHTMERELQHLKQQIKEKVRHSFLLQHIDNPEIDEYKLYFLQQILNKTTLAPKVKEQLIITTMLVQIALDIHEQIPDYKGEQGPSINVESQLSILAGDYYSGLYYYLLAEIEEREYITVLATAIKHINELKMELYYLNDYTIENYLNIKKEIQITLIKYIADHVRVTEELPVMAELLLLNYMIHTNDIFVEIDKQSVLEAQVNKTKGMLEGLQVEDGYKQNLVKILHTIVYQHTALEMD